MTKKETLKLKQQSRDKWRKIVKDLGWQSPKLHPKLTASDCGYCKIYEAQDDYCCGCCLIGEGLCRDGSGDAFEAVRDFYEDYVGTVEALRGAKKILVAIERDIKKSEKKK